MTSRAEWEKQVAIIAYIWCKEKSTQDEINTHLDINGQLKKDKDYLVTYRVNLGDMKRRLIKNLFDSVQMTHPQEQNSIWNELQDLISVHMDKNGPFDAMLILETLGKITINLEESRLSMPDFIRKFHKDAGKTEKEINERIRICQQPYDLLIASSYAEKNSLQKLLGRGDHLPKFYVPGMAFKNSATFFAEKFSLNPVVEAPVIANAPQLK